VCQDGGQLLGRGKGLLREPASSSGSRRGPDGTGVPARAWPLLTDKLMHRHTSRGHAWTHLCAHGRPRAQTWALTRARANSYAQTRRRADVLQPKPTNRHTRAHTTHTKHTLMHARNSYRDTTAYSATCTDTHEHTCSQAHTCVHTQSHTQTHTDTPKHTCAQTRTHSSTRLLMHTSTVTPSAAMVAVGTLSPWVAWERWP
jgi:hypothetical protein